MATQPTFVIAGYYGFGNWGDEATLQVLLSELREALPQVRLIVLSNNPRETTRFHHIEAVNRWDPLKIYRALRNASAFILGPGSLLQDISSTRSLLYYLGLLRWAGSNKLPIYLIGQGIGPLHSPRSERWVVQTLRQAQSILLRDRASLEWALSRQFNSDRLVLGEDLALLTPPQAPFLKREGDFFFPLGKKVHGVRLGLALRPGLSMQNVDVLRRVLASLAERFPLGEVVLLPFHSTDDKPVLRALTTKSNLLVSLAQPQCPNDLLHSMRELDLLIGMRLHSLVFALLVGLPFCALSYDPKVESFLKRVGEISRQSLVWWRASDSLDEQVLSNQIEQLYVDKELYATRLLEAREVLRDSAQQSLDRVTKKIVRDFGDK